MQSPRRCSTPDDSRERRIRTSNIACFVFGVIVPTIVVLIAQVSVGNGNDSFEIPIVPGLVANLSSEREFSDRWPINYSIEIVRHLQGRKIVILPKYRFDSGREASAYERYRLVRSRDGRVIGLRELTNYRAVFMYDIDSHAFWPPEDWMQRNAPSQDGTRLIKQLQEVEPKLFGPRLMSDEAIRLNKLMKREKPQVIQRARSQRQR